MGTTEGAIDDAASFHEIAKVYDAYARTSPESACNSLQGKNFDHDWIQGRLKKRIREQPLLDVGCGAGSVANQLSTPNDALIGIDLSAEMISLARRHHPQHAFYVMNAQSLRFPTDSFGGAVAYFSLIHLSIQQLEHAIKELGRVLQAQAPLLISLYGPRLNDETEDQEDTSDLGLNIHAHEVQEIEALFNGISLCKKATITSRPPYPHEVSYEHIFIDTFIKG